ncbi:hypothetical protein [Pandoraea apista]|uniref:hypothetical protein n=1 Tax=Pandoraea apista TaxID=93218 RepID=UPI0012E22CC6|nr:hypothetical protein [Pandoraea apista]
MSFGFQDLWTVVVSHYESPSSFTVSVQTGDEMLETNHDIFAAGRAHARHLVMGLFHSEQDARDFARMLQTNRNAIADLIAKPAKGI